MALSVPLSRSTLRVGVGSAFFVRRHSRMKTWHTALIGAVGGPVIGIPILMATGPASTNPFLYPVVRSMIFLSDIFTPDRDMAGLIFLYPLLVLYFAIIGVAVAFAARLLWRKFAV